MRPRRAASNSHSAKTPRSLRRTRPLPLEGIRVTEISLAWAVPHAGRLFSIQGAEVIKVESHTRPDVSRTIPYPENRRSDRWWDASGMYHIQNQGKYGVTLNFATREGRDLLKQLVSVSDIVLENFAPRVLENFELSYPHLRKVRPDLIMVSSSAYGHSGPWRDYVGWGMGMELMTGLAQITGYADGPPTRSAVPHTDLPSALYAFAGALAALEHRKRTGKGQWIDLSQYQVGISMVPQPPLDYVMNARVQARQGNRDAAMAPQNTYRCKGPPSGSGQADSWLAISVATDAEWRALACAIGRADLAEDARYASAAGRLARQDELDRMIAAWAINQDHLAAMHFLQAAGVPAAAVLNPKELLLDPHLRERFWEKVTHPLEEVGVRWHPGSWYRLSDTPAQVRWAAPTMGQHNQTVLGGLLGLSDTRLEELREGDTIGERPPVFSRAAPPSLESQKAARLILDYDVDYRRILGYEE